ncbi:SHOCT domain-containing protein [Streptomyces sp. NPDC090025]|uniref:SHOCT domain-containing protein n=1 Tax=Streptomyces sp. NPDC090025 TaxID=3365922 RepID=UPI0038394B2C
MNTLAHAGPGPWILFFPLVWAAVIVTAVTLLRRFGPRRGPWGRFGGPWGPAGPGGFRTGGGGARDDEQSPIARLGNRFAAGEIDEEEYWRRLTVLEEQFGRFGADRDGRQGKGRR